MVHVTLAYDIWRKRITCSIRFDHVAIIAYLYGCVNTFPVGKPQKNANFFVSGFMIQEADALRGRRSRGTTK